MQVFIVEEQYKELKNSSHRMTSLERCASHRARTEQFLVHRSPQLGEQQKRCHRRTDPSLAVGELWPPVPPLSGALPPGRAALLRRLCRPAGAPVPLDVQVIGVVLGFQLP